MHIKSFNFLSGSLQQEFQKFRQDQSFSQAYSNLDKEFRAERIAVQYQDPTATMKNGFVENFDPKEELIEDHEKGKDRNIQAGSNELQNNEPSVYERLLEGNVSIQFDSEISSNAHSEDMLSNSMTKPSMNAVMNVMGDDNFSQKIKNDSNNWAQMQNERVSRVEEELQNRHKSRFDRDYDNRHGLTDRNGDQRRSNDIFTERKNQVSQREQSQNDYNRRDVVNDTSSRRRNLQGKTEELQNVKNLEKKRTTKHNLEERLQSQKRDEKRSQRTGLSEQKVDRDVILSNKNGIFDSQQSKQVSNVRLEEEVSSKDPSNKGRSGEENTRILREGEIVAAKQFIEKEHSEEVDSIKNSFAQMIDENDVESINKDTLTAIASILFSDSAIANQSKIESTQDSVTMNDISGGFVTESEMMSLSDITEVVSEQDSILDDNTLISTVLELQEELLELSDNLYLNDDMSVLNTQASLLINVPSARGANSFLLQQIKSMAKPLGSVMKGLQALHQKPNISMMDDFILDMKWDSTNSKINKMTRPGMAIQSLFSNSTQNQLQNEVQNVFEQGLKASAVAETSARGLGTDFINASTFAEEQTSMQVSSIMGTSLEGGQADTAQQDVSTLLQNIDSKQLKELQKVTSKKMFSKMVRVIEHLMEQYKPPFDPNVLKQLEIRVQDPAGVIILDISQDKSQILVKAIIPDSIHQEFSQTKGDIESSLSEHGLELGSWEMTKQSETEDSHQRGNRNLKDQGDLSDANENIESMTEGSDLESDRLVSKNI